MGGFILTLFICFLFGFLGQYIANKKNRSSVEGFLIGFCLSLMGVLIVLSLPTKEKIKVEYTQEQIEKKEQLAKEGDNHFKKLLITLLVILGLLVVIAIIL